MSEQTRPSSGGELSDRSGAVTDPQLSAWQAPPAEAAKAAPDERDHALSPSASTGDDYKVGYGRPPCSSRFQPGRSGNPKGRPKGAKCLRTLVRAELDARVEVRENGKASRLSKRQVAVKRQVNKALEGDHRAFRVVAELDGATSMPTPRAANDDWPTGEPDAVGADDRAILDDYVAKVLAARVSAASTAMEDAEPANSAAPPGAVR